MAYVIKVGENESLALLEAACNDVFRIFVRKPVAFLQFEILPQIFFIIRELNDERDFERVLQISGELEGDEVSQM